MSDVRAVSRAGATQPAHLAFLAARTMGHLVTLRADGRPHVSNVLYHLDAAAAIARISVTTDRLKVRNVRRDPRAVLHVDGDGGWTWLAADAIAELSPVTTRPDDPTAEELVALYRAIRGEEHPNWTEFREAMVAEQRLVMRLQLTRTYGLPSR